MTAGVPWSVNAVEPETWASARDAARRAGLSVGEWLELTIRESAGEPMRPPRAMREPPRTGAIEQRLDDITDQLDHLMAHEPRRARPQPRLEPRTERTDPALAAAVAALNGRVESLIREVDDAERRVPSQIEAAFERLDSRLEAALVHGRSASAGVSTEIEKRLSELAHAVEDMSRRLDQEPAPAAPSAISPSIAELDDAIAEITVRQSNLDGRSKPPLFERRQARPGRRADDLRPEPVAAPDMSALERQLKAMAEEMQQLRRSGVQVQAIDELRRQVFDLAETLGQLAPRHSIEQLEHAIEELSQRIDRAARTAPRENFTEVASALADIRSALSEVRPAESFSAVEADLQSLSRKLDIINAQGIDSSTLARIQAEITETRQMLASALPTEVLKALVDQIEMLVQRFESGPAAASVESYLQGAVANIAERIDRLGERVDAVAHVAGGPAIAEISARLDELQHALADMPRAAPAGFESLLHGLMDKIDATEAKLSGLGAIERGLNDLFAQFEETRASAIDIAERAARSAIREAAANLVGRPQQPSAPEPVRRAADYESRSGPAMPAAEAEREHEPPRPAASARAELPPSPREALRPEPTRLDTTKPEPAPIEPAASKFVGGLPPDYPLEPGSGSPRDHMVQSATERVAQSEAALGPIAPRPSEGAPRAADFIAAARRAAQQAAAEKAAETPQARAVGVVKELGANIGKSKRSLLIGLLAILLVVVGTMRFGDVLFPSFFSHEEPAGPPTRTMPTATPAPAPVETPAPAAPTAPADTPNTNRSALPTDPMLATVPPAGIVGPSGPTFLGTKADPRDVTGTIAATMPKPGAIAFRPNELPAAIGTLALRTAALAGDPVASYEIAARYFDGRGVEANAVEALRWFELARVAGSPLASYRLGNIYEKGHGVTKNLGEARRYYLLAAEAGHIKAMHNLAVLYAEGIDGKPDFKTAARWFRMSADRGLRDSQYNLGVLYARGLGIEQNLVESYRWFALAAVQGDTDATKKQEDVANRLDAQSLIAAKIAVHAWKATAAEDAANVIRLKPEWEKAEPGPTKKRPTKN